MDIDYTASQAWVNDKVRLVLIPVCKAFGVTVLRVQKRKSLSKGFHLYAKITPPITARLANRIQFLAGDDPVRVRLNGLRISARYSGWSKLWWYPHRRSRTIYTRHSSGRNKIHSGEVIHTLDKGRVRSKKTWA